MRHAPHKTPPWIQDPLPPWIAVDSSEWGATCESRPIVDASLEVHDGQDRRVDTPLTACYSGRGGAHSHAQAGTDGLYPFES